MLIELIIRLQYVPFSGSPLVRCLSSHFGHFGLSNLLDCLRTKRVRNCKIYPLHRTYAAGIAKCITHKAMTKDGQGWDVTSFNLKWFRENVTACLSNKQRKFRAGMRGKGQ